MINEKGVFGCESGREGGMRVAEKVIISNNENWYEG